jgi:hypothetical protein
MNYLFKIPVIAIIFISLMLIMISCKPKPMPPVVTTTNVTGITQTTATTGGNVTDDGGAEVTSKGVCWNTSENPTVANSKTSDGKGTGSFTSSLTQLTPGTNYYVRAYATNSEGTGYGNQVSLTTGEILLATLTTTSVTSITSVTAVSGGNITADGGGAITDRGVCWSTSQNPTISDSKTTDGSGIGSFTSNMTGLSHSTIYYVRAYATNSAGTAYGNQESFTTLDFNIVPGEKIGDFNLGDNMQINVSKIVSLVGSISWLDDSSSELWSGELYWNGIRYDTIGINFVIIKNEASMLYEDVPDIIMAYEPFKGCTEKGITLGSLRTKVATEYGTPDYIDSVYGDYYYDSLGIGFYVDNTKTYVLYIIIYEPGYFDSPNKNTSKPHKRGQLLRNAY